MTAEGLTLRLAERAAATRWEGLPAPARQAAAQAALDFMGCALAGAEEPVALHLGAELADAGGAPQAGVIGRPGRLPVAAAALLNGAAGHALDFDDVNMGMPGHPTVAILPAPLALGQARGASGAAVLTALVAGTELACRVGRALAPGHYDGLGFHATATVGCLGAAAGAANLLGLDGQGTAVAMGIAATQAAGLKSQFGTDCKPLHAGAAARTGVLAARLAARGFTARTDAIECAQGFAATHSPDFDAAAAGTEAPGGYYIISNLYKFHAACYLTHAPIEALRGLRERFAVAAGDVAEIRLTLADACDRVCNIAAPRTGLEAKFSLRQTAAMALAGVETGALASYSAETARDPKLVALRGLVAFEFRPELSHTDATVALRLRDGRVLTAHHDSGVPAPDLDAQAARLAAKFQVLAAPVLGAERAETLGARMLGLGAVGDVGEVMALAGG